MPVRGWYPDPDQTPGRYRFWDGTAWTAQTTHDPGRPPAAPPEDPPGPGPAGRRGRAGTLALLAVLLVLALVATVVAVRSRSAASTDDPLPPRSTRSAWDDRSPTPPTLSPSGSSTSSAASRLPECDQAAPNQLQPPQPDGRVHGGPLSFRALPAPWSGASPTRRFPFSRDAHVQTLSLPEKLPWQASAQVGVAAFGHYPGRHVATESMLNCLLTSDFYTSVAVTLARSTGAELEVSGVAASRLDALLTFSHPRLKTRGSLIRIIVVDTSPVTYYFSAVPMERQDLIRAVDQATSSLTAG